MSLPIPIPIPLPAIMTVPVPQIENVEDDKERSVCLFFVYSSRFVCNDIKMICIPHAPLGDLFITLVVRGFFGSSCFVYVSNNIIIYRVWTKELQNVCV